MRFLIDADCPRSVGTVLKAGGHKVKDIRDIKASASDKEIKDLLGSLTVVQKGRYRIHKI